MALQDLTPELRTRLGRVERWVGVFVTFATLLLLVGLSYYLYQTAKRKGWFEVKVPYHTYVQDAAGLKVGDPVKMMGFDVGEITQIEAMGAYDYYNVFIQFEVKSPYYGYLWTDTKVRVGSKDFLGGRFLEVTKGTYGASTVELFQKTNIDQVTGVLDMKIKTNVNHVPLADLRYVPLTNGSKGYWLSVVESPALTERLEQVINLVEGALPNFLNLTNQLRAALTKVNDIASHTDDLLVGVQPIVTNLTRITANLTDPNGSLGQWIIPTNINQQLAATLASSDATLETTRSNIALLSGSLLLSLDNVATLTSNLNAQVQANAFILGEISSLIVSTDDLMQGLKRHWLLKGAFAPQPTNATLPSLLQPRLETRDPTAP